MEHSELGKLKTIIAYFLSDRTSALDFCDEFERQYNLNTDPAKLTSSERSTFDELLQVVAWYSPFREERRQIQNYVDEDAVMDAAKTAARRLGMNATM
jgi:hypothetical protein